MRLARLLVLAAGLALALTGPGVAFAQDGPFRFHTLAVCRALDTRTGIPLQNGVPQAVTIRGVCGVPDTAQLVSVNVTAVGPTGSGQLSAYPTGESAPDVGHVSFSGNDFAVASGRIVTLGLGPSDDFTVQADVAGNGTVHLLVDVNGYFEE